MVLFALGRGERFKVRGADAPVHWRGKGPGSTRAGGSFTSCPKTWKTKKGRSTSVPAPLGGQRLKGGKTSWREGLESIFCSSLSGEKGVCVCVCAHVSGGLCTWVSARVPDTASPRTHVAARECPWMSLTPLCGSGSSCTFPSVSLQGEGGERNTFAFRPQERSGPAQGSARRSARVVRLLRQSSRRPGEPLAAGNAWSKGVERKPERAGGFLNLELGITQPRETKIMGGNLPVSEPKGMQKAQIQAGLSITVMTHLPRTFKDTHFHLRGWEVVKESSGFFPFKTKALGISSRSYRHAARSLGASFPGQKASDACAGTRGCIKSHKLGVPSRRQRALSLGLAKGVQPGEASASDLEIQGHNVRAAADGVRA